MIKHIGLPLRGRPILLITRMITDRIGLHSVLLPLLKNISFMTDLTDFRKTVETGAVPRLGAVGELPRSIIQRNGRYHTEKGKKFPLNEGCFRK